MEQLTKFFDNSDSSLGVFHPKDCIVATFRLYREAKGALEAVLHAGIPAEDTYLATSEEAYEYFNQFKDKEGLLGTLFRPLSRFIGTEAINADVSQQMATEGAGFVAIKCPTEERALLVGEAVHPHNPVNVDWYLWGGVRSLIKPVSEVV